MSRPTIRVEQPVVVNLDFDRVEGMLNCVNDRPLWGFPARCIKFSDYTWDEVYHRFNRWFHRSLVFEGWRRRETLRGPLVSGWDRNLPDEGTMALRGKWVNTGTAVAPVWAWVLRGNPNPQNPMDFERFIDTSGNMRRVLLNGNGIPYNPVGGTTVLTCTQCPAGAPSSWVVSGFAAANAIVNDSVVPYLGGCTWQVQVQGPPPGNATVTITIEYIVADALWRLGIGGLAGGDQFFTLAPASWACLGPNTLTGIPANPTVAPATMTVSAAVANQPGTINIQKYAEANFLELGIPASLE